VESRAPFQRQHGEGRGHNPTAGRRLPGPAELARVESNRGVQGAKFPSPGPDGFAAASLNQPAFRTLSIAAFRAEHAERKQRQPCQSRRFCIPIESCPASVPQLPVKQRFRNLSNSTQSQKRKASRFKRRLAAVGSPTPATIGKAARKKFSANRVGQCLHDGFCKPSSLVRQWKSSVEFSSETYRSVFRGMSLDDLGGLASEVRLDVLATASSKQAPGWVAGGKPFRVSFYAAQSPALDGCVKSRWPSFLYRFPG
jgi:hypothetical protein